MTEPEEHPQTDPHSGEDNRQAFAFVVENAPNGYGAYAPDFPASFVAADTFGDALQGARDSLAGQLQLIHGMGDLLPGAQPETAERLRRAGLTESGEPAEPGIRIAVLKVGPEDAPADAPTVPDDEASAPSPEAAPRRETFSVVVLGNSEYWCAYIPDLRGGLALSHSLDEALDDLRFNTTETLQRKVDLGEPIPEERRTPEEALAYHRETATEAAKDAGPPTVETMTVELQPPRPAARLLQDLENDALTRREKFEAGGCRRRPLKPGASWKGRYAAVFEFSPGIVYAYVPDLPGSFVSGDDRAEARHNLRTRIALHLYGALSREGTIPLPRRGLVEVKAYRRRQTVEHGFDPAERDHAFKFALVPVEIRAPYPDTGM